MVLPYAPDHVSASAGSEINAAPAAIAKMSFMMSSHCPCLLFHQFHFQRLAQQVFHPFDLDQDGPALLLLVPILFGWDQAFPDLFVDGAGLVHLGVPVQARDAADGQALLAP